MKKQLQGIAIILLSVLFMLGYGHAPFFDLSFRWSAFLLMSVDGTITTGPSDHLDFDQTLPHIQGCLGGRNISDFAIESLYNSNYKGEQHHEEDNLYSWQY